MTNNQSGFGKTAGFAAAMVIASSVSSCSGGDRQESKTPIQPPSTQSKTPAADSAPHPEGTVFKWVDQKGRTHYGNDPAAVPKGARAVASPPPGNSNRATQENRSAPHPYETIDREPSKNGELASAENRETLEGCPSLQRAGDIFKSAGKLPGASSVADQGDIAKGLAALCAKDRAAKRGE